MPFSVSAKWKRAKLEIPLSFLFISSKPRHNHDAECRKGYDHGSSNSPPNLFGTEKTRPPTEFYQLQSPKKRRWRQDLSTQTQQPKKRDQRPWESCSSTPHGLSISAILPSWRQHRSSRPWHRLLWRGSASSSSYTSRSPLIPPAKTPSIHPFIHFQVRSELWSPLLVASNPHSQRTHDKSESSTNTWRQSAHSTTGAFYKKRNAGGGRPPTYLPIEPQSIGREGRAGRHRRRGKEVIQGDADAGIDGQNQLLVSLSPILDHRNVARRPRRFHHHPVRSLAPHLAQNSARLHTDHASPSLPLSQSLSVQFLWQTVKTHRGERTIPSSWLRHRASGQRTAGWSTHGVFFAGWLVWVGGSHQSPSPIITLMLPVPSHGLTVSLHLFVLSSVMRNLVWNKFGALGLCSLVGRQHNHSRESDLQDMNMGRHEPAGGRSPASQVRSQTTHDIFKICSSLLGFRREVMVGLCIIRSWWPELVCFFSPWALTLFFIEGPRPKLFSNSADARRYCKKMFGLDTSSATIWKGGCHSRTGSC